VSLSHDTRVKIRILAAALFPRFLAGGLMAAAGELASPRSSWEAREPRAK
jgi:hypothetical protein